MRAITTLVAALAAGCGSEGNGVAADVESVLAPTTDTTPTPSDVPDSELEEDPPLTAERMGSIMTIFFHEFRDGVVATIKADSSTEAVVSFEYDQDANEVTLDLASAYQGIDDFRAVFDMQAWDLTQAIAQAFWNPDTVDAFGDDAALALMPAWRLTLDAELVYECPAEVMAAFANKDAGQAQFEATCFTSIG